MINPLKLRLKLCKAATWGLGQYSEWTALEISWGNRHEDRKLVKLWKTAS